MDDRTHLTKLRDEAAIRLAPAIAPIILDNIERVTRGNKPELSHYGLDTLFWGMSVADLNLDSNDVGAHIANVTVEAADRLVERLELASYENRYSGDDNMDDPRLPYEADKDRRPQAQQG